jgi:hypothetical protein
MLFRRAESAFRAVAQLAQGDRRQTEQLEIDGGGASSGITPKNGDGT